MTDSSPAAPPSPSLSENPSSPPKPSEKSSSGKSDSFLKKSRASGTRQAGTRPSERRKTDGGGANRTPTKNKKKPSSKKGLLFLCLILFLFILFIGCLIFGAVCNSRADWSEIPTPTSPVNGTEGTLPLPYGDGFVADMAEYEPYINPILEERDLFLVLVDGSHRLTSSDQPDRLTAVPDSDSGSGPVLLSLYAEKALEAMLTEMKAQGVGQDDPQTLALCTPTLGYRSYEEQEEDFRQVVSRLMREDPSLSQALAEDIAAASVSPPGTDEHQTGLCVDLCPPSSSAAFRKSEAFDWLCENAWKFGFILRYPEDKTEITGMAFDPGHFRYVGRFHSTTIHRLGLCLEEYLDLFEESGL